MQRRLGYAQWRVSERAGDRLVGIAGLQPLDGGPEVELTYALEPSSVGRRLRHRGRRRRARVRLHRGRARACRRHREARERGVGARAARSSACARWARPSTGAGRGPSSRLTAAAWRAEQAAARPPLLTERLELRRFAAADLEPLLAVFGDAAVMRYVGAERRPLDRDGVAALLASAEAHWSAHGFGPLAVVERADRAPGRRGRPAAARGRPGRRARLHAGARRLGSRLRDRGGARRPALGVRRPAPAARRRRRRPRQPRLAARARQARHDAAGHARLLRRPHGGVRAVPRRLAGAGRPRAGAPLTRRLPPARAARRPRRPGASILAG